MKRACPYAMSTSGSLVGREPELQKLRAALAAPAEPALAFIEGEAGVGKTALLETIAAEAAQSGRRVFWTRPTARESGSSYAALDDLMRPFLDHVPQLAEPQRRAVCVAMGLEEAGEPVEPRLVGLGCLALVTVRPEPALLAVDDWQWLDAASELVLAFVVRRLDPARGKVIATLRRGEADERVAALLRGLADAQATEVEVGPLDVGALRELVHDRTGVWLSPPGLARLHDGCGGNPLVALELMRAPHARGSTDIGQLLARRVGRLSVVARDALRFVAALAEPSCELVEAAMGDARRASRGLEEALAAEILERDGTGVRFAHPLLADAVQALTPPGEWRAVHWRLAGLSTGAEVRARHLAAATSAQDRHVAEAIESAAEEARARGAVAAAAELAERAAELTPSADVEAHARRIVAAADAHAASGDGMHGRELLAELVKTLAAGPLRAEALHRLGYVVGDDSGPGLVEQALAEAGEEAGLVAELHHSMSALIVMQGNLPKALEHAEAAVRHGERAGAPLPLAGALANLAFDRWIAGDGVQRDLLMRADELERQGTGRLRDVTALGVLAMQVRVDGELAGAREMLLGEVERAERRGRVDHEAFAVRELAELEVRAGRWELSESYARRVQDLCLGNMFWNSEGEGYWITALVDAHRGNVKRARESAETGLERSLAWGDLAWSMRNRAVLGFIALSLGDAPGAVERLSTARANERALGIQELAMAGIVPDLCEALVLVGDLDRAKEEHRELESYARGCDTAWGLATALRCRGLIAAAERRMEHALAELEQAVEVHGRLPLPFERARSLLALGSTQRRARRRAEARASLEAALALFEELGAETWAARSRTEIARLGGRRARDRDELTEAERRIAALAAEGRLNREIAGELFVSERTVEANLTRAYRKLGVRSRTELARRLSAR